jgi:amidophosphoribosyltransferase
MPTQEQRANAVRLKLNPIKSAISGKRIVLVEDSIVRGNTINYTVKILRSQGAKEVHVRVASPPIIAPCYFGVDMKTRDQFLARDKTMKEIADEIGADSVGYISIDGLIESIGLANQGLCLGCLTGSYPVPIPGEKYSFQSELENYQNS